MEKKIFVTGVSGVGKSTLGHELQARGCSVIDVDEADLCSWYDLEGNLYGGLDRPGENWLDNYRWKCDLKRLEKVVEFSKNEVVYIIGNSSNLDGYPFDKIFLLTIDSDQLIERLIHRTTNGFGKDPAERKHVLANKESYEKKMTAKGAIILDASRPVPELADQILFNKVY